MDDKKNFKIEFDDDFDAWLAQHEKETKDLKPPVPSARDIPVQRQPAADVPVQKRPIMPSQPASVPPVQPAADVPVQKRPIMPSQPASVPPVQPAADIPVQKKTADSLQVDARVQEQVESAKSVSLVSDVAAYEKVEQPKPDSQQFKPVDSNSNADDSVKRSDIVKNFKVEINEEDYNKPAYEEPEQPVKRDKSVYFAGRKPTKTQVDTRNAQERAMREKRMREKQERAEQYKKERKQITRLKRFLVFLIIIMSSISVSTYGISCMNDVLALNRSKDLITVTIEKGAGFEEIIDALDEQDLIKHKWFCKLVCKFRGFDKKTYLHGVHYLTANMGVEGMLTEMLANQTSDKTIRLSFPEGWTLPQIIEKLDENNVCPAEYIYTALDEIDFDYDFIDSIPKDESRCYAYEGYLFPDTYDFFVSDKQNGIGENPTSILNKLLGNFESRWSEVYTKRAKELNLTMDEVIIIASIIQKEAADKSQMGVVSSVLHNRLENSTAYPLLECNSTRDYVTNNIVPVKGDAGASEYIIAYDTYNNDGLPPGPICNPGIDAIEAALNPDDTDYLYFCHNEAGKIYLAKTYSQHQSNWAQALSDNEAD